MSITQMHDIALQDLLKPNPKTQIVNQRIHRLFATESTHALNRYINRDPKRLLLKHYLRFKLFNIHWRTGGEVVHNITAKENTFSVPFLLAGAILCSKQKFTSLCNTASEQLNTSQWMIILETIGSAEDSLLSCLREIPFYNFKTLHQTLTTSAAAKEALKSFMSQSTEGEPSPKADTFVKYFLNFTLQSAAPQAQKKTLLDISDLSITPHILVNALQQMRGSRVTTLLKLRPSLLQTLGTFYEQDTSNKQETSAFLEKIVSYSAILKLDEAYVYPFLYQVRDKAERAITKHFPSFADDVLLNENLLFHMGLCKTHAATEVAALQTISNQSLAFLKQFILSEIKVNLTGKDWYSFTFQSIKLIHQDTQLLKVLTYHFLSQTVDLSFIQRLAKQLKEARASDIDDTSFYKALEATQTLFNTLVKQPEVAFELVKQSPECLDEYFELSEMPSNSIERLQRMSESSEVNKNVSNHLFKKLSEKYGSPLAKYDSLEAGRQAIMARIKVFYDAQPAEYDLYDCAGGFLETIKLPADINEARTHILSTLRHHGLDEEDTDDILEALISHPWHKAYRCFMTREENQLLISPNHIPDNGIEFTDAEQWSFDLNLSYSSYIYSEDDDRHLPTALLCWEASRDQSIPDIDGITTESRESTFLMRLGDVTRAHNFDNLNHSINGAFAPGISTIEQDDGEYDKPACLRGLDSRYTSAVLTHPLIEPGLLYTRDVFLATINNIIFQHMKAHLLNETLNMRNTEKNAYLRQLKEAISEYATSQTNPSLTLLSYNMGADLFRQRIGAEIAKHPAAFKSNPRLRNAFKELIKTAESGPHFFVFITQANLISLLKEVDVVPETEAMLPHGSAPKPVLHQAPEALRGGQPLQAAKDNQSGQEATTASLSPNRSM